VASGAAFGGIFTGFGSPAGSRLDGVSARDALLAVLVTVIWGVNFVVIDVGLDGMPPLVLVALRFVVVVLPLVFLVPRPNVPWRVLVFSAAFLSIGQFGLLYTGMAAGMPPGLASLVLQAQVIFTVLIAAGRLRERPTPLQLAGIAVGGSAATPLLGLLLCVAAALSWATGNVVTRRAGVASGLSMVVWASVFVPVPMLLLAAAVEGPAAVGHSLAHITLANVFATLFTAYLASLVGFGIWNGLLARYPAAVVTPFALLVPVFGMTAAFLLQGERPGPAEVAGGVVLLLGVTVTLRGGRRVRSAASRNAEAPQPVTV
jgi:O-acetylserine/cysteine efflux transporter